MNQRVWVQVSWVALVSALAVLSPDGEMDSPQQKKHEEWDAELSQVHLDFPDHSPCIAGNGRSRGRKGA